jgi:hypothetical protein
MHEDLLYISSLQKCALQAGEYSKSHLRHYFGVNKVFSVFDMDYILRFRSEGTDYDDIRQRHFSPTEHPVTSRMLWELNKRIAIGAKALEKALPDNISLGTLPLGSHNAMATKAPSGNYILLFHAGLFPAISALVNVVMHSMEETETAFGFPSEETINDVINDKKLNDEFFEIIHAYFILGSTEGLGQEDILLDKRKGSFRISNWMIHSCLTYVLAHEYAHIIYGHIDKGMRRQSQEEDQYKRNWADELSCDLFGLAVTFVAGNIEDSLDASLATMGIEIFLSLTEMSNDIFRVCDYSTHPPPLVRRTVMLDSIERNRGSEAGKTASLVWGDIQRLLGKLWLKNKPRLVESIRNFEDENRKAKVHDAALMFLIKQALRDRNQTRE